MSDVNDREGQETGQDGAAKPATDPGAAAERAAFLDTAKALVTDFRAALTAQRESATPPPPTAPPVDVSTERSRISAEYQALCEAGKYADAANYLMSEQSVLAQRLATPGDPTTAPAYKALLSSARRAVKQDNPDLFADYSAEIEAEVTLMPAVDRINPDSWSAAIERVRGRHFDELVAKDRKARTAAGDDNDAAGERTTRPPSATSARTSSSTRRAPLDDDARRIAAAAGLTEDQFRTASDKHDANVITTGFCRGMVKVLPDAVTPGRF